MSGTHRLAAPSAPDGAGLRALAELVLSVLRGDPRHAFAVADGRLAMAAEAGVAALPGASAARTRDTTTSTPPGGSSHTYEDVHEETWLLVSRAQQGDGDAFGLLYDRYVDTVFRYIYYRVNDKATAEDFTSETFLRALRRIGSISYQGRDIGAWFITIARNIVLDHVKSARHRLEVTTGDVIERDDTEPGPETAVISTLTAAHLMGAVNRLGDDQRECIVLRFIEGLSVSETAEVMGRNDGAVKALQHRAVRKLADMIGSELR